MTRMSFLSRSWSLNSWSAGGARGLSVSGTTRMLLADAIREQDAVETMKRRTAGSNHA
jgi:hypothetical protein